MSEEDFWGVRIHHEAAHDPRLPPGAGMIPVIRFAAAVALREGAVRESSFLQRTNHQNFSCVADVFLFACTLRLGIGEKR